MREFTPMSKKTLKLKTVLLISFIFLGFFPLFAEEFQVIQSFSGLDDVSRYIENENINADLSGLVSDQAKAERICEIALRSIAQEQGKLGRKIILQLKEINNSGQMWYAVYSWQFESEFIRNDKLNRLFKAKVDFQEGIIVYEKDAEVQFSDGTE